MALLDQRSKFSDWSTNLADSSAYDFDESLRQHLPPTFPFEADVNVSGEIVWVAQSRFSSGSSVWYAGGRPTLDENSGSSSVLDPDMMAKRPSRSSCVPYNSVGRQTISTNHNKTFQADVRLALQPLNANAQPEGLSLNQLRGIKNRERSKPIDVTSAPWQSLSGHQHPPIHVGDRYLVKVPSKQNSELQPPARKQSLDHMQLPPTLYRPPASPDKEVVEVMEPPLRKNSLDYGNEAAADVRAAFAAVPALQSRRSVSLQLDHVETVSLEHRRVSTESRASLGFLLSRNQRVLSILDKPTTSSRHSKYRSQTPSLRTNVSRKSLAEPMPSLPFHLQSEPSSPFSPHSPTEDLPCMPRPVVAKVVTIRSTGTRRQRLVLTALFIVLVAIAASVSLVFGLARQRASQ